MLYKIKSLDGYRLESLDGGIGHVNEFYFDDHHWTIRYLVVNTGTWLTGRQVLISPYALISVNKEDKAISVNLTKKQIEDSPSLESNKPVSRQYEESYHGYYGWPMYWTGSNVWGAYPGIMLERIDPEKPVEKTKGWDSHLRSTNYTSGYHIQSVDGEIGHVDDFIIDDENWTIRYLVVSTTNWFPGKKVLISPEWIDSISWSKSRVFVNLTRDAIKGSPEYTAESLLSRDYESKLHGHYDRQGYWLDDSTTRK
jgi:uncharacterized protein YrrD